MPDQKFPPMVVPPKIIEAGKELVRPDVVITPKIIEDDKEIVRPDVVDAVTQLAILGQLAKIRKSLQRQEFEGREDPRTLNATDELQFFSLIDRYPNTPWIRAYFINKGPKTVLIAVNYPYDQIELGVWESRLVDRAKADERISTIFYVCNPGETASVSATGEY